MIIVRFEDIVAWQKSRDFVKLIYQIFGKTSDFGFRGQILRASVSIMNNIAEGFEKKSNKDFIKFLNISKGSCGEVRSMLYVAKDVGYLEQNTFELLYNQTVEISKILSGFIRSLKSQAKN